jgi:4-amino-4-deoxy-L-arabinose transferase-like glycosyltransferase
MLSRRLKTSLVLLSLSVVCASVNLTKAVHIDDTAYLEIAQAILEDPLHPMSLELNWDNTARPIFLTNQPILLFYLWALVMLVFGESELVLHLLMTLMTSFAILSFYLLARLLVRRSVLLLTAVLFLGPAFLPGQNLMVDVPLLALWLVFFWAVFAAFVERPNHRYLIAAIAIAVACLVKYTSLVLLPIFLLTIALRRQWRSLWLLTIPIATLAGWSLFNYFDYGSIHLLERNIRPFRVTDILVGAFDWTAGLGAVAPFGAIFFSHANVKRLGSWFLTGSLLASGVVFLASYSYPKSSLQIAILWALFFGNGILTLGLTCRGLMDGIVSSWQQRDRARLECNVILALWLAGAFSFIVLFSSLMAIRHILLAVPAFLLLLEYNWGHSIKPRSKLLGSVLTVSLGVLLALSDYHFAGLYREQAHKIIQELPPRANIWYAGHWGWQWYAEQGGMCQYDTERTVLSNGDYLVVPSLVHRQMIRSEHQEILKRMRKVTVNAEPLTWFRTMSEEPRGGYYAFSFRQFHGPPWRVSTAPLDTFSIFVVVDLDR